VGTGRKFALKKLRGFTGKLKVTLLFLCIALIFVEVSGVLFGEPSPQNEPSPQRRGFYLGSVAIAAEEADIIYYGDAGAEAVLGNLNYTDVSRNIWSQNAIYEVGALGILKGEAYGRFGRTVPLTKEEAIALAYRAVGREAEAQELGIALNNARPVADRKTNSQDVLYDGFLQLAMNDGLISARDLADAFNADQTTLADESFRRKSSAQRQQIAYWLARTLNVQPVAQQQELLNYTDWRSVDPDMLMYVEALLRGGIINGSGGRINPRQPVTREQAAQIVKNAESFVLGARGYLNNSGIVESIAPTQDYTDGSAVSGKNITITNANGRLVSIITSAYANASGTKNENTGAPLTGSKSELVVLRNGILGNSNLLNVGDRIQYITDSSNTVKYVFVISNIRDVRYLAVQISGVDRANLVMDVIQLFDMNYPDISSISGDQSFNWSKNERSSFRIAESTSISVNGIRTDLSAVTDDATAILTLDSNNLVKEIQCVDFGINTEARRVVRGIVEENNPDLGYLTLFNEDGSGSGNSGSAMLRTYNYVDQNKTEIYRNHKLVKADSIQAGDTAYIRLDDDGDISSISAVDNYTKKYGKIISKLPTEIIVEYEDGTQQLLFVGDGVLVVRDKLLVGLQALNDGDRVRLLINETNRDTDLKEITIEGTEHYVTNIYKGRITNIDDMSDKITVLGMQVFNKGNWERIDWKGVKTIPFADGLKIYSASSGGTVLDIDTANRLLYSNEAYIAVEKTYGGEEQAVLLSYRNSTDTIVPTNSGTISGNTSGSGSFILAHVNREIYYSAGSIVVKNGRLTTGNSLNDKDKAYLALDREYSSGNYYASVVSVDQPQAANGMILYRGRIKDINEELNFTLESFSQLQGTDWEYSNTPKTLNITFDTRVLIDVGVLNIRDFKGYGADSYLNRTVYVVADGPNAVLVSTAPYGIENVRGTVSSVNDDEISLRRAKIYNASTYMWDNIADTTINVLKNSVIIKDGRVSNIGNITKGTTLRIIKKDASTVGDVYIIFIE
jgi:hypothetical protein